MSNQEVSNFESLVFQPEMLSKVLDQLYKDLNIDSVAFPWNFGNPDAYVIFHHNLTNYISSLYTNNSTKFMRMLNRVDISEKIYKGLLLTTDDDNVINKLTDLILNRALQKVITRTHYNPLK